MDSLFASEESLTQSERRGVLAPPDSIASPHVTQDMRSILVDWMMQVCRALKLKPESFFSSVCLLDAMLARDPSVLREEVQLYATSCLLLAVKYHEIKPPEITDMMYMTGSVYISESIEDAEKRVFKIVGCSANVPEEMAYWKAMSAAYDARAPSYVMGKHLLCLLTLRGSRFLPSVVVTAVRWLMSDVYKELYMDHFEVPEVVVDACIKDIILTCRFVRGSRLQSHKDLGGQEWLRVLNAVCATEAGDVQDSDEEYLRGYHYNPNLTIDLLPPSVVTPGAPQLGQGSFGLVVRVQYLGKMYAVKKVLFESVDEGVNAEFSREVSIMQSLDHPNIAKVQYMTSDLRCIFMDLGVSDMDTWIEKQGNAGLEAQVDLARQLLFAIAYMHSNGCLHRDIKTKNIIVFSEGAVWRVVLSDFGSGRGCQIALKDNSFTQEVGTLWYLCPELLMGTVSYGPGIDVWGILCTLYKCATGKPLFYGDTRLGQLHRIFSVMGTPGENAWPGVSTLPGYKAASFPTFERKARYFSDDLNLSPCYKELLSFGLIVDPARRPTSARLCEVLRKYLP